MYVCVCLLCVSVCIVSLVMDYLRKIINCKEGGYFHTRFSLCGLQFWTHWTHRCAVYCRPVSKVLTKFCRWSLTNSSTHDAVFISLPELKWLRNFGTVLRILYVGLYGLTGNICEVCRLLVWTVSIIVRR